MNPIQKLTEMQEVVNHEKDKYSRAKGKLETLYHSLEKDFGCKNLKQAKSRVGELASEKDSKERTLIKGIQKLEEDYEW